jgi:hypothetical protein
VVTFKNINKVFDKTYEIYDGKLSDINKKTIQTMKIIQTIRQILKNLKAPRYSIIYKKENGSTSSYVLINPSIFHGNKKVTFSNDIWRKVYGYDREKGFRALVDGKGIRSFNWAGIKAIHKLSPLEMVN